MIKHIIKTGFRFTLSLSLVLVPSLSYPQVSGHPVPDPSAIQKLLDSLKAESQGKDISPEVQEASRILEEMEEAFQENRLSEYIDSKPSLKEKFDVLSLGNQEVKILDYKEDIKRKVYFDTSNNDFFSYKRKILNIDVEFNEEGKLVFKGVVVSGDKKEPSLIRRGIAWLKRLVVSEDKTPENSKDKTPGRRIGLVHTFNDVEKKDVISWDYDKEFLVLLHKKRGLVLYNTIIAREFLLGSAPIPSISLLGSKALLNLLKNEENIKLEFIHRAVSPPLFSGLEEERARDKGFQVNLDGKPIFTAGDLLVSRTDSEGKKHIVKLISRKDVTIAKVNMYQVLYHLVQIKNLNTNEMHNPSLFQHFKTILSATFHRKPIGFFSKFAEEKILEHIRMFLVYRIQEKDRDVFTLEEWRNNWQMIEADLNPRKLVDRSRNEGNMPSFEEIAKKINPEDLSVFESEKQSRLKKVLERYIPPALFEYFKNNQFWPEHGIKVLTGAVFFVWITMEGLFDRPRLDWNSNYAQSVAQHLVLLGGVLLFATYVFAAYSISFTKIIKPIVGLFSGEAKLSLEQFIEKWDKKNTPERLTSFGFRIASLFLPIFDTISRVFGGKNFYEALRHGINPLQKITPESRLGKDFALNKPLRVGGGWPSYRGSAFKKREQMIPALKETKSRVEGLSLLMTYYALSGKSNFDLTRLLTGPETVRGGIIIDYYMEEVVENKEKKDKKRSVLEVLWVSQKLSKYILKSNIDTTRPLYDWDVAMIENDFYQKALDLASKVKPLSLVDLNILFKVPEKFAEYGRGVLNWNTEKAKILKSILPAKPIVDQYWSGLIMDHLLMVLATLTSGTPRGEAFYGNMSGKAVDRFNVTQSSAEHLNEVNVNILLHTALSARQQLQYLYDGKYERLRTLYKSLDQLYKPFLTEYFRPTNNKAKFWSYFKDWFSFPVHWGHRIYEGDDTREERVDAGIQAHKFVKGALGFWMMTIPLMLIARVSLTPEYSFWSNFKGVLYFVSMGFFLFALPQVWAIWHNSMYNKKAEERKALIDHIKFVLDRMEKRNYTSVSYLNEDYKKAILGFKKLYDSSKKFRKEISSKINTLDPRLKELILQADFRGRESLEIMESELREIIESQTMEEKVRQMKVIRPLLDTAHLPTEANKLAYDSILLLTLGVFSNLAFVYASEKSFATLRLKAVVLWIALFYGFGKVANFLGEYSLRDHRRGQSIKPLRKKAENVGRIIREPVATIKRCVSAFKRNQREE